MGNLNKQWNLDGGLKFKITQIYQFKWTIKEFQMRIGP